MIPTRALRRDRHHIWAGAFVVLLACACSSVAHGVAAAATGSAPADSSHAATAPRVASVRANWFSDRLPLAVGDLITVTIDERTQSSETVSRTASGQRSLGANLDLALSATPQVPKAITSSFGTRSTDTGAASRNGNLVASITVRVTALDPSGLAHIEGAKTTNVDGRASLVTLKGIVRSEDVDASNHVDSERVADAVITYKGKAIAPRSGILGGILKMLWP